MLGLATRPVRTTVNAVAIRRVVAAIEAEPGRWDQDRFLGGGQYGQVFCFAGWACFLAGYDVEEMLRADPNCGQIVKQTAAMLLGLSAEQAFILFHGGTSSLSRFKRRVTAVTGVEFR